MTGLRLRVVDAARRIRSRDGALRAFVTTRLDAAIGEDSVLAAQKARSSLHGAPYSLKDEWDTAGLATTGGSYRHRERVPSRSATVHHVFSDAGAVLMGKTNLSDMGLAPEASSYVGGSTRNPHDLSRTAGGSSGGAAAAVADGMVAFDWGTDIGGSIRMPAAFTGVFGMRLSSETWPIEGLFPAVPTALAWLCGQGPFTRTIPDMAAVLEVADPRMRTGTSRSFSVRGAILHAPDVPGEWPSFRSDVENHVARAVDGEVRVEPGLPGTTNLRNVYSAVWASHLEDLLQADPSLTLLEGLRAVLSSVLLRGRLGDRRFHPATAEILALIALGRATLYRDRQRALHDAETVRAHFGSLWDRGFLVVAPVCAFPPPRVGRSNRNPHLLSCTVSGNLADATALAVPFGTFGGRFPRALQLLGPPGSEHALLRIAERLVASRDVDPALRPLLPPA